MPARESFLQSHGCPQQYDLKRGGTVTLRNGSLYRDGVCVASNGTAVAWLCEHAKLTADQAYWLPYVLDSNSRTVSNANGPAVRPGVTPQHGGSIQ